jgi:hypothetical protein
MADLATLRSDLATALESVGSVVVFAYPKEQPNNNSIILVPSSPYILPVAIGGLSNRLNVRFDLTVAVAINDTQAALANIESLMLGVLNALPQGVSIVSPWSGPIPEDIGPTKLITSQITIEVVTTNNGN